MTPEPPADDEEPTGDERPRETPMRAYLVDGPAVDCAEFKAIDAGVLLLDERRDRAVGFVPHDRLRFVLPRDAAEAYESGRANEAETASRAGITEYEDVADMVSGADIVPTDGSDPQSRTSGEETAVSDESDESDGRETTDLRSIRGLGPTYADRLRAAGIESTSVLRRTSVHDVAAAASVSEKRAVEWITRAVRDRHGRSDDNDGTDEGENGSDESAAP